MSNIIVHLDPKELQYRRLRKQEEQRHNIQRPNTPQSYSKLNKLLLKEMEAKNKAAAAEEAVRKAKLAAKEDALRARATQRIAQQRGSGGNTPRQAGTPMKSPMKHSTTEELAKPSPRKDSSSRYAVLDKSAEITVEEEKEEKQKSFDEHFGGRVNTHGVCDGDHLPAYLVKRMEEQHQALMRKSQEEYVQTLKEMMPEGMAPMNENIVNRTVEFLKHHIQQLTKEINAFSFSRRDSVTGKMKLATLEDQLQTAEDTLRRFSFPIVFVKRSEPVAVHKPPQNIPRRRKF